MDYFKDEKQGNGSFGISGGGGGGAVSGGSQFDWIVESPEEEWVENDQEKEIPGWYYSKILRENGQWLLLEGSELLTGTTPCREVPLLVTIHGKKHTQCMRLEIPGRSLEVLRRDDEKIYARFDFSTPGEIKVYAKWQAGHHNYKEIHSAEFKILGKSYGIKKIPLGKKILVARVEIV